MFEKIINEFSCTVTVKQFVRAFLKEKLKLNRLRVFNCGKEKNIKKERKIYLYTIAKQEVRAFFERRT